MKDPTDILITTNKEEINVTEFSEWIQQINNSEKENNNMDKWDVFLSHKQIESGDVCHALNKYLQVKHNMKVWYDNEADDLKISGMEKGVKNSKCFLLFVTENIFDSNYCKEEIAWALEKEKQIIIVYETSSKYGRSKEKVGELIDKVPDELNTNGELTKNVEWIPYKRMNFF